jgi:hypothetical protein
MSREADPPAWRGAGNCPSRQEPQGLRADVSPLAGTVRRDEGRRCEAPEGARARERAVEADRGGPGAAYRGVQRGEQGKLGSPRRRQAVRMLQDRLGISQRRVPICRTASLHSAPRGSGHGRGSGVAGRAAADLTTPAAMGLSLRAHRLLPQEGWELNRERARSGCGGRRACGCRRRRRKRQRRGESTVPARRLRGAAGSCVGDRPPVRSDR